MRVELRPAPDDDVQTALDLYAWLRKDPDIRRHAELTLGSSDPTGEAMGATEIVGLVLGQTFAALNLALAYASWRAARRTAPPITITVGSRSLTVAGASEETLLRIVELLGQPGAEDGAAPRPDTPDEPPRRDGDGTPGPA
ncbi:hypothetical protein ACGF3J_31240 [Streptomyces sp. NPDC048171]|uniref:effector-associated constant component EACC1 n=1 Tax=unclassified Streptomyces TaxID=2593676 RepID=UPI0019283749|nr:hypothetical protein [Streptomyces sp. SID5789]